MSDNPPCNTLFVGNLSDNINESELTSVFSTSPVSAATKGGFVHWALLTAFKMDSCQARPLCICYCMLA